MADRDFPVKEGDISLLLNSLAERLPTMAASLDVSPAEIAQVEAGRRRRTGLFLEAGRKR